MIIEVNGEKKELGEVLRSLAEAIEALGYEERSNRGGV
jgi:sulfur carrier protein ThiS